MRTRLLRSALMFTALICTIAGARADDAEYRKIRQEISKLAPLIGKWNAAVTFHDKDGLKEEVGTGLFPQFSTTHISSSKQNVTLRTIQTGAARSFGMSHSIPGRIAIKQLISTTDGRCE